MENAEEARALIYHYRLIRIAGAMDAMKADQIPQTIVRIHSHLLVYMYVALSTLLTRARARRAAVSCRMSCSRIWWRQESIRASRCLGSRRLPRRSSMIRN